MAAGPAPPPGVNEPYGYDQKVIEKEAAKAQKSFKGRLMSKLDNFQQKRAWLGFPYAVQKKYGDDEAGNQAALVTYYGFLSLFPLLVAAMSLTQLSLLHNAGLKTKIITSLDKNFPIVGSQLQDNVHATQKAGIALVISIILTLYGSRGVATALQTVMNHVWQVPKFKRGGLVANLKSIAMVILIGVGFIATGIISGFAASPDNGVWLKVAAIAVSLAVIYIILLLVFKLSIAARRRFKELFIGTLVAAIGLQIVQALGGLLITHELKNLSSLYGTFAVILAILFWIYLQTRILLYGAEIDTVRSLKLWPRGLTSYRLTAADQRALKMYAGREQYEEPPKEEVEVRV